MDYQIGYAIVFIIFITNALEFIFAAPFTHAIESKIGCWKGYALSMGLLASGYTIITRHPPFPAVVVTFFLLGFGMAHSIALNAFCANLPYFTTALGCFTGAYGIGGVIPPLTATAMASRGILWSHLYAISLGISLVNLGLSAWAFFQFEENPNIHYLVQGFWGGGLRFWDRGIERALLKWITRGSIREVGPAGRCRVMRKE